MTIEELKLIKDAGFVYSINTKLLERNSDDGFYKDYLIIEDDYFHIERELYLQESDGTFYTDYQKIFPDAGITLTEFLINY
jgi:hypothetical protein